MKKIKRIPAWTLMAIGLSLPMTALMVAGFDSSLGLKLGDIEALNILAGLSLPLGLGIMAWGIERISH